MSDAAEQSYPAEETTRVTRRRICSSSSTQRIRSAAAAIHAMIDAAPVSLRPAALTMTFVDPGGDTIARRATAAKAEGLPADHHWRRHDQRDGAAALQGALRVDRGRNRPHRRLPPRRRL